MAIGYSGIRAQTMLLQVREGIKGTKQNIYIHTQINRLQPMLKSPFILDAIKNTTGSNASDAFANTRYYYNKQATDAELITDPENPLKKDPRTLEAENIDILVAQIAPVEYAKKFSGSLRDLQMEGLEQTASVKISDFMEQRRITKQLQMWAMAIDAAETTQKDSSLTSATTFDKGAHYVTETFTDGDDIYNSLSAAINSFQKFGLPSAINEFNKSIDYVLGINKNDMIILMSPDCAAKLLKLNGLFASDTGNKLFQDLELTKVLGVPMRIENTLPEGVNFIITTTGTHGALAYETCGKVGLAKIAGQEMSVLGLEAVMMPDPNWSGFYRIDISDTFKMGIVFPELILVSSENASSKAKTIKADLKSGTMSVKEAKDKLTQWAQRVSQLKEQKQVLIDEMPNIEDAEERAQKGAQIREINAQIRDLEKQTNKGAKVVQKHERKTSK